MKRIVICGLAILLVVTILDNFTLAMGKKAAQGSTEAKKAQEIQTETKRISEAQAIEPKPVMEYKFDEPIVDVIFDETEMTVKEAMALGMKGLEDKKATDKVKVQYPKVVFVAQHILEKKPEIRVYNANFHIPKVKSIKFLNEKGNLKNEVELLTTVSGKSWSRVTVSKNKKYIGINNVYKYHQKREYIEDGEFIMMNDEGKELWKMKHNLSWIYTSPNGKYIVGVSDTSWGDAPIYVYNEKGLIKEIKKETRDWELAFSKDGSYFAVITTTIDWNMKTEAHVDRYRTHLIVFDEKGNELWRKKNIAKGESAICDLNISEDDIITVITGKPENKTYCFDKQGNLIGSESKKK